jgi:leader peptidase (prepilin peptidase) / N-methyltransferase
MELIASLLFYVWLFCFGACVGSFLNVVVYRLPRGMNLAYPGSRCPRCGHAIRLLDNIPILSWLALAGRCRDCGGKISIRYLWVELLVASAFLVVAGGERWLPAGSWGVAARPALSPADVVPYWLMYGLHVSLLTTSIGAVLILGDHQTAPGRLFLPVIVLGFAVPLIWPELRSVPAWNDAGLTRWQSGLIDGLAGLAAGTIAALTGSWCYRSLRGSWPPFAPVSSMAALGVVFGWQRALLWSGPLLALFLLSARGLRRMTAPPAAMDADPRQPDDQESAQERSPGPFSEHDAARPLDESAT